MLSGDDMTVAYKDKGIPAKQRELVDRQLAKMKEAQWPSHFDVTRLALKRIQREEGFPVVRLNLLDAGCSSAYYSEIFDYFCPGMVHYTGVDYSPAMVDMAHTIYPDRPVFEADLVNLRFFLPHRFDIGFTGATIIHMRQWRLAIRELARVSRKWLVLHRTNVWSDDSLTSCTRGEAYDVPVDYYIFNRSELFDLCATCGFLLNAEWDTGEGVTKGAIKTFLLKRKEYEQPELILDKSSSYRSGLLQSAPAYAASP